MTPKKSKSPTLQARNTSAFNRLAFNNTNQSLDMTVAKREHADDAARNAQEFSWTDRVETNTALSSVIDTNLYIAFPNII